jgi:energy-converting hydrogenase A subunit M
MNSPKLKITLDERDLIQHRLDVPDAIAEALADTFDDATPDLVTDAESVVAACETLHDRMFDALRTGDGLDKRLMSDVEIAVLIDAIEGSTFLGVVPDELPHEQRRVRRVGNNLASKVSLWLGRRVTFPTY